VSTSITFAELTCRERPRDDSDEEVASFLPDLTLAVLSILLDHEDSKECPFGMKKKCVSNATYDKKCVHAAAWAWKISSHA